MGIAVWMAGARQPAKKASKARAPRQSTVEPDPPRRTLPAISRDIVLFTAGLGLMINEAAIRSGPERPTLVIAYFGMMGIPVVQSLDFWRRGGE